MLIAGLLGARKKVPVWRLGRMQTWMRAHLWLGFLSFPLILFHANFHTGGKLTTVLVWIFAVVFVSGIFGRHDAALPAAFLYHPGPDGNNL